jgi:hypothetical protein
MSTGRDDNRIFRNEALEYQFRDSGSQGVLKASPVWSWSVLLISLLLVITAATFLFFAEVELPQRVEGVFTAAPIPAAPAAGERSVVATAWLSETDAGQLRIANRIPVEWHDPIRDQAVVGTGEIIGLEPVRHASGEIRYRMQVRMLAPETDEPLTMSFLEGTRVKILLMAQKRRLLSLITGAGGPSGQ